jgi:hypothetical protein
MYDQQELVDEYVSQGGHAYRPDLRVAIFKWINKHMKNERGPVKDVDFKPIPGKELRVFLEDKDIPKDQTNGKIDETFVAQAAVKLPEKVEFAKWQTGLLKELRERSFRTFPKRIPAAKLIGGRKHLLETEQGIYIGGSEALKVGNNGAKMTSLLVYTTEGKQANEAEAESHMIVNLALSKKYSRDGLVLGVHLRGVSDFVWTEKSPPNYVKRSHALLGRTVDQGRVWDIIAAVRYAQAQDKGKHGWRLIGEGQAGILAAYAALFEPSIQEVVILNPPPSQWAGPVFLNVLRVLDIPEALGLLAPRRLTLINAKDKAFDRTEQIYKLAGAESKLTRK